MQSIDTTAGIARAAMIVTMNVSLYSGRKQDKRTQAEVVAAKGSGSTRAASVYRNLFADCKELEDITKFQARARNKHYAMTLPWSDNGQRLLPTKSFMDYTAEMDKCRQQFDFLVDAFLAKYETLVAAAAFKLGALFDRDEYPTKEHIAKRFTFTIDYTPVPLANDFRVDIEHEVQQDLVRKYEDRMAQQLASAQQESWTRLYEVLTQLKDRLTLNEDGTRKIFKASTVTNAVDLCEALTKLNVTNDPALESARRKLEDAMMGVEAEELRKEEGERLVLLQKVDTILDSYNFGDIDE
jgi:hypothetical protein